MRHGFCSEVIRGKADFPRLPRRQYRIATSFSQDSTAMQPSPERLGDTDVSKTSDFTTFSSLSKKLIHPVNFSIKKFSKTIISRINKLTENRSSSYNNHESFFIIPAHVCTKVGDHT